MLPPRVKSTTIGAKAAVIVAGTKKSTSKPTPWSNVPRTDGSALKIPEKFASPLSYLLGTKTPPTEAVVVLVKDIVLIPAVVWVPEKLIIIARKIVCLVGPDSITNKFEGLVVEFVNRLGAYTGVTFVCFVRTAPAVVKEIGCMLPGRYTGSLVEIEPPIHATVEGNLTPGASVNDSGIESRISACYFT